MEDKVKELTKILIEMNEAAQNNLEEYIRLTANQCPYYNFNEIS